MKVYFFLAFFLITCGLLGIYIIGLPHVYTAESGEPISPHLFDETRQPIHTINLIAFYFVPRNKVATQIANWREILVDNLQNLKKFHELQFGGSSQIHLTIYPNPVIGYKDNLVYDTSVTQRGNPAALRSITQELDKRVFDSKGDLYWPDAVSTGTNAWQVSYILYEGIGASGTIHSAILSRIFLTDPQYLVRGPSYFAHEFYHTLGIPDGYDLSTALPNTDDIMGAGRERPLDLTYLSGDTLKKMGL